MNDADDSVDVLDEAKLFEEFQQAVRAVVYDVVHCWPLNFHRKLMGYLRRTTDAHKLKLLPANTESIKIK